MRDRALKKKIISLLAANELDNVLSLQTQYPRYQLINPLIGCLCHTVEMVKWRAVHCLGQILSSLADDDMEAARIVMRRFMWMLNDESGGIGWGVPEVMGEVMARHERLAEEYAHIPVANMREEGNFLELPMLQRGLMWGIGRLSGSRPILMRQKNTGLYLPFYYSSEDPEVRGRALWASGQLGEIPTANINQLLEDRSQVTIYEHPELNIYTISELFEKYS